MCAECKEAHDLLRKAGYSEKDAMAYLWEETPFPIGPGKYTLAMVKEHLAKRRRARRARVRGR